MKSNHTQGQWSIQYFGDNGNRNCRIHSNNVTIAKVIQIDEAEANARIIAAAPQLLESCIELLSFIQRQFPNENGEAIYDAIQAIKAATE